MMGANLFNPQNMQNLNLNSAPVSGKKKSKLDKFSIPAQEIAANPAALP